MLEIVKKGRNNQGQDWHDVWKQSEMRRLVDQEIEQIHHDKQHEVARVNEASARSEFAITFSAQLVEVIYRISSNIGEFTVMSLRNSVLVLPLGCLSGSLSMMLNTYS